jgi:hypothetical protein
MAFPRESTVGWAKDERDFLFDNKMMEIDTS